MADVLKGIQLNVNQELNGTETTNSKLQSEKFFTSFNLLQSFIFLRKTFKTQVDDSGTRRQRFAKKTFQLDANWMLISSLRSRTKET